MAETKASGKIDYSRRDVFVSSFPGEAAGALAEPIALRIRNNSDEDLTEVRCRASKTWGPGQLQDWLEKVTDFVLLVDDDLCSALREARLDEPTEAPGLELLVVLGVNDARAKGGGEPVRLWLAKAETVRLVALKKVAGRAEWNLDQQDREGLLHWLYEREEKVLEHQESLRNKKFVGEDEKRLGRNIDRFVDHQPQQCEHCDPAHPHG